MTDISDTHEDGASGPSGAADSDAALRRLRQPVPQEFDIRIAADGSWYHEGGLIGRPALVKLFSTVLRREADGSFWLVTPVERGRIEVEEVDGVTGVNLRTRAIQPVVRLARALAVDIGALDSANTFDRLRAVGASDHPLAAQAKGLVPSFTTLVDVHLREQMQAAERGEQPTDLVDPDAMHRSQQNLLKETLKGVQSARAAIAKHYKL